jgi:hypothetical protein
MITHTKCGKSHLGVIRKTNSVEYRVLNDVKNIGNISFKGNWKQEKKQLEGEVKLKCLACETEISSGEELTGCSEFKIHKTKGVLFITNRLDRWT